MTIHGLGASGSPAFAMAFQERQIYRAVLNIQSALRLPPPDNEPDLRLQFYLAGIEKSPQQKAVKSTADALRKLKFPVVHRALTGDVADYPVGTVAEFVRWLDALDRI